MRTLRTIGRFALLGAVIWGVTAPADAQRRRERPSTTSADAAPAEDARAAARESYARGQELFRAGRYAEAQTAFEAAYAAVPNAVVLLSIAQCQENTGNANDAALTLSRYLDARPDAPDRASIEQRLQALRARPATLIIETTPPGASIAIDGTPRSETTPAEVQVPAGERTVTLTLDGYESATESVTAGFGARANVRSTLRRAAPPADAGPAASEDDVFGGAPQEETTEEAEAPSEDAEASGSGAGVPTAAWVTGGVAAAGLVAGTVFGFLALSKQSDFEETPTTALADDGEQLALFADVSFAIALGAGVATLVLALSGGEDSEERAESLETGALRITPSVGPQAAGVAASLAF